MLEVFLVSSAADGFVPDIKILKVSIQSSALVDLRCMYRKSGWLVQLAKEKLLIPVGYIKSWKSLQSIERRFSHFPYL